MTTRRSWMGALAAVLLAWAGAEAVAMSVSVGSTNLVGLLRDSESIVVGQVESVTDGIDAQGVPYTEISLAIGRTIRGDAAGTYTFRQFGLVNPRPTADGTKVQMPAPAGFPRYAEGEQVLLFLYPAASWTGLRSTVGLGQGKFVLGAARAENDFGNEGLFRNVSLEDGLATPNDNRMLATATGAVNQDDFVSLVTRAVEGQWVEKCLIWNTDEGKTCRGGGKKAPTFRPKQ